MRSYRAHAPELPRDRRLAAARLAGPLRARWGRGLRRRDGRVRWRMGLRGGLGGPVCIRRLRPLSHRRWIGGAGARRGSVVRAADVDGGSPLLDAERSRQGRGLQLAPRRARRHRGRACRAGVLPQGDALHLPGPGALRRFAADHRGPASPDLLPEPAMGRSHPHTPAQACGSHRARELLRLPRLPGGGLWRPRRQHGGPEAPKPVLVPRHPLVGLRRQRLHRARHGGGLQGGDLLRDERDGPCRQRGAGGRGAGGRADRDRPRGVARGAGRWLSPGGPIPRRGPRGRRVGRVPWRSPSPEKPGARNRVLRRLHLEPGLAALGPRGRAKGRLRARAVRVPAVGGLRELPGDLLGGARGPRGGRSRERRRDASLARGRRLPTAGAEAHPRGGGRPRRSLRAAQARHTAGSAAPIQALPASGLPAGLLQLAATKPREPQPPPPAWSASGSTRWPGGGTIWHSAPTGDCGPFPAWREARPGSGVNAGSSPDDESPRASAGS